MTEQLLGESLLKHIKALFVSNGKHLHITCLGHLDTLGSSISVTTEDVLVDEFQHAIATIEAWESIKITDRNGNEVFSILNADSE